MLHSVLDCSTNDGHILAPSCNLQGASQSFGFVGTITVRTLYSFIFWNCVLVTMNRHLKSKTQFHILCSVIYPALFTLMFSTFIHVFSPRNIPFLCFCPFLSLSQQHVCSQGIFLSLNVKLNTDILVEKYFLLKKKETLVLRITVLAPIKPSFLMLTEVLPVVKPVTAQFSLKQSFTQF